MKSIVELEKYLEEDYYSFTELTIGKHCAQEGYITVLHLREMIY